MENQFVITEENLIGNVATVILQLKRLKEKKEFTKEFSFFVQLIDFIGQANNEDYEKLLYDKHFIISEWNLNNLHKELIDKKVSETIDLAELKNILLEVSTKPGSEDIDKAMKKLTEIAHLLWQMKNRKQIFM